MKMTASLALAALLLCALLLAACGGSAQQDVPAASGIPGPDSGPSAEQPELTDPAPEGGDSPLPAETEPPPAETEPPPAETDPPPAEADPPAVETEEPVEEPPSPFRLGETEDAGHEYLEKMYFLGDSTTYWLGYYYDHGYSEELVPSSHIWTGPTGTMTLAYYATVRIVYETGEQISIREAVERTQPEYLVITLGVNGISFMDEEWFVRAYTDIVEIVKEASPETKIILNSIFPISTTYPYQWDVNNDKIRAANGWIEQIAEDTGTRFLNSYESVVGEDGNLPVSGSVGDGLHLSCESFETVMRYFRTHAYK